MRRAATSTPSTYCVTQGISRSTVAAARRAAIGCAPLSMKPATHPSASPRDSRPPCRRGRPGSTRLRRAPEATSRGTPTARAAQRRRGVARIDARELARPACPTAPARRNRRAVHSPLAGARTHHSRCASSAAGSADSRLDLQRAAHAVRRRRCAPSRRCRRRRLRLRRRGCRRRRGRFSGCSRRRFARARRASARCPKAVRRAAASTRRDRARCAVLLPAPPRPGCRNRRAR